MIFVWRMIKVNETLSNSNGHIQTTLDENGSEEKPMLQVKMNGNDDQGINALINRQLQGNFSNIASLNVLLFPFNLMSFLYCSRKIK